VASGRARTAGREAGQQEVQHLSVSEDVVLLHVGRVSDDVRKPLHNNATRLLNADVPTEIRMATDAACTERPSTSSVA
jgi:hypothetical protein